MVASTATMTIMATAMRTTATIRGDDANNYDDDEHSHDDSDEEWARSEYANGNDTDTEPHIIMTSQW